MPRYLKMEENEDGTILGTSNINGTEETFLIPFSFDQLVSTMLGRPEFMAEAVEVTHGVVVVPNDIAGLES